MNYGTEPHILWSNPQADAKEITTVVHSGSDAVASANSAWMAVLERSPPYSIFSRPEWASTWYSVYGAGHPARIVEFRHQGAPVAIAPLQLTRYPGLGTRRLEFLSGAAMTRLQWWLNPRHPGQALHNDLLIVPGFEDATLVALRLWLTAHSDLWDELRLTCVPNSSPLTTCFQDLARGWSPGVQFDNRVYIDTSGGWSAYRSRLSKRQKRHLRYEPHALARAAGGEPELVVWRGADASARIGDFLAFMTERWAASGRLAMPGGNRVLFRHLAASSELGPALYTLVVGGRTVAMQFGFDDGRRYIPLGFAYDPALERASSANVLFHYAIKRCCEDGHAEVDLAALNVVDRWAGVPRPRAHLSATSPRTLSRVRAVGLELASRGLASLYNSGAGRRAIPVVGRVRFVLSGGWPKSKDS